MSFDAGDLAYGIVEDYLEDGPDYLAIAEAVYDNTDGDVTDEMIEATAEEVRLLLDELRAKL